MSKYIVRRLLTLIPVIVGVTFIVFFILNLSPGDPAAIILGEQATEEALAMKREELHLNDPLLKRYGRYMWDMLHGDLGLSYKNSISVWDQVIGRFPNTCVLAVAGILGEKTVFAHRQRVHGFRVDRRRHAELLVRAAGRYRFFADAGLASLAGNG